MYGKAFILSNILKLDFSDSIPNIVMIQMHMVSILGIFYPFLFINIVSVTFIT